MEIIVAREIKLLNNDFVKNVLSINDLKFQLNRAQIKQLSKELQAVIAIEPEQVKLMEIIPVPIDEANQGIFGKLNDGTVIYLGEPPARQYEKYLGKAWFTQIVKELKGDNKNDESTC